MNATFKTMVSRAVTTLAVGTIACAIFGVAKAKSEECFRSDDAVRAAYGETTWSAYTHHMDGHEGTLCYYPSIKGNPRVHLTLARKHPIVHAVSGKELVASIVPEPRPRVIVINHDPADDLAVTSAPVSSRFFGGGFKSVRFSDVLPRPHTTVEAPARSIWMAWTHDGWCDEAFMLTDRGVEWPLL